MYHSFAARSQKDAAAKAAAQKEAIANTTKSKTKNSAAVKSTTKSKITRSTRSSKKPRINDDNNANKSSAIPHNMQTRSVSNKRIMKSKPDRMPTIFIDDDAPLSQLSDLSQSQVCNIVSFTV